ncbi:MAG: alpha/beta fold hydrolase [bacterium]|nr:MAG: alpha/beta fold hydrolase [bacterium]
MAAIKRALLICTAVSLLCIGIQNDAAGEPPATREDELIGRATRFVELLRSGEYQEAVADFDETMKSVSPPGKLEETWKALIAQVGPLKRRTGVRQEPWKQYELVFVTCEFERALLDIKVVFDPEGRIAGMWFQPAQQAGDYDPPGYSEPDLFNEREVTVGSGEWALPGTLTLPDGKGPFPAVVLVHGSGPQDRDETIGPNKPFRDIAEGLSSRGIAVLRYEKRTKEHATRCAAMRNRLTVKEETVDDALAAVELLRRTQPIDGDRIFVLGHSLGGMVVPRIGGRDPRIAGFIIMAGANRPMEDMILEQTRYISGLDGTISDEEQEHITALERQVARVKAADLSPDTPADELPFGIHARYWLDLRGFEPAKAAASLARPIMILHGERDYQVTAADLRGWKRALADRKDVTVKSYRKLNHLFIEGNGASGPSEYQQPGHVATEVIEDITRWIGGIHAR